jgi:hypothetical protein
MFWPCTLRLVPCAVYTSVRKKGGGESSPFPVCDPERDTVSPVTDHCTIDVLQDKIDDLVKSPTPSLRGATRRGNLSAIQGVLSPPWRDIPGRISVAGDSQDFTLESEVSLPGLGQGLPRFARNDRSAFFGLFTKPSRLVPPTRVFKADIRRSPSASTFLGKSIYFEIVLGSRRVTCNTRPMPNRDFQGFPKLV